jgi:hypothetical protein
MYLVIYSSISSAFSATAVEEVGGGERYCKEGLVLGHLGNTLLYKLRHTVSF